MFHDGEHCFLSVSLSRRVVATWAIFSPAPLVRADTRTLAHAPAAEGTRQQSLPLFDCSFDFAAGLAGFDGVAAVVQFLALRQSQFDFGESALGEIDPEGNEGQAFLLGLAEQLVDFLPVQEQFPHPDRIMVHDIAVAVGTDVTVVEEDFPVFHARVTVLEIDLAFPQRLDLRALQLDTGLEALFDEIVMEGLPVGRHGPFCLSLSHPSLRFPLDPAGTTP